MKKILCVFLVLSMLVVSVSAADVYDIEPDTVVMKSSVSTFSSGVTPLATGSDYSEDIYDWLDTTLIDMLTRADGYFISMDDSLLDIYSRLASTNSLLSTISGDLDTSNYWLQQIFGSISDFATEDTLLDVLSEVSSLDTILAQISNKVATETTLSDISDKVATDSTVSSGFSSLKSFFTGGFGYYLTDYGGKVAKSDVPLVDVVRDGFAGLYSMFSVPSGTTMLYDNGSVSESTVPISFPLLVRYSSLGIRSLIAGSESDNVYSGSITSNENIETSFTATGLGPMLNKYMDAIQHDTGLLSYMFASPADIQAKKDSESLTGEMADSFLKPDSDASIKLSDVGILKDSSTTVQELGDTGVTPGQAFSQLTGNSDLFAFFSQETASDLDTTVMTLSDDSDQQIVTTYYEDSRAAFYELIGKGGDE